MRTSRVSQETSKFFNHAGNPELSPGPRRSARLARPSLSHFANDASTADPKDGQSDVTYGSDIEDAIKSATPSPPLQRPTRVATRKRKRTAATATAGATTSRPAQVLKAESSSTATSISAPAAPPRRTRKPARKTTDPATGTAHTQPPTDWEEMYEVAKQMRLHGAAANAAVDTMGCERLAAPSATARDRRFHTLVALMLSSQTKDTVNAAAMARLQAELPACAPGRPAGLTLENVLAADPALLNELIGKVGFHNNKTRYIKRAAELLRDRHGGDIPDTAEGLMALPGVGPKMAYLCLAADNGWSRVEGIGVDVHVHRITNLWGWQQPPTRTPEETRLALQAWLPRDRWKEINWLLVGLGQSVCLPVGRRCGECELGLRGLCKAAERKKVMEGRRRREELVLVEGDGGVVKVEETVEEGVAKEEVVDEEARQESATPIKQEAYGT